MNKKLTVVIAVIFVVTTFVLSIIAMASQPKLATTQAEIPKDTKLALETAPVTTTYEGSIVFMGDAMFARSIGTNILKGSDPFQHIRGAISGHTLRVINVETTIANSTIATSAANKTYTFNAPLGALDILKTNNITVSSLANNHTGDFGASATVDMVNQFRAKGLATVGAGNNTAEAFAPLIVDMPLKNNNDPASTSLVKVGFVAVNDIELAHTKVSDTRAGGAYFDIDRITASIASARQQGAVAVFVLPHWGVEYQTKPSARQVDWGKKFIDAGADAVIGTHPHVVQPTEIYNGKPIVYSLGNFIFDGMEGEARRGQMVAIPITLTKTTGWLEQTSTAVGQPTSIGIAINSVGFPELSR